MNASFSLSSSRWAGSMGGGGGPQSGGLVGGEESCKVEGGAKTRINP